MKRLGLSLVILVASALPAAAAPGDQWILGIHHFNDGHLFTEYEGDGYDGPQSSGHPNFVGNAYLFGQQHGVARVYWELSGPAINSGRLPPDTAELYTIEFWGTSAPGRDDWHPIESQFHGSGGEEFPIDSAIPWAGQFGTNHQWIGADAKIVGDWQTTGPGPQAPDDETFNAPGDGIYMWLKRGSWLYAKWDFPWTIEKSWSALRLTQITGEPAPDLVGDYNDDGIVDAADYVLWRKTGINGQDGYDDWRANYGMVGAIGSGQSLAVPEPESVALLLFGLAGLGWLAARRRAPALAKAG